MAGKGTPIILSGAERAELEKCIGSGTTEYRMMVRSKIVLLADEGVETQKMARQLQLSPKTVCKWRTRFAKYGLEELSDTERPGRLWIYTPEDELKVINISCQKPEAVTHWSLRDLTQEINKQSEKKMSPMTIQRIIKSTDLKPHQYEMW